MQTHFHSRSASILLPNWIIATATLLVFLPALPMRFWLIDDHEIVFNLQVLNAVGPIDFWRQWLESPDFHETFPRFRPIYHFLRALETLLWRDTVFMWAICRATIAFIFAVSVYKLGCTSLPPSFAMIFALLTLCGPWLPDSLFRLGPSEAYAIFFSAILILALIPENQKISWLTVSACVAMLIGVKENNIVLMPFAIWAVFSLLRDRRPFSAFVAVLCVLFSCCCVLILAYKFQYSSGLDVYSQTADLDRFGEAAKNLFLTRNGWLTLVIIGICLYLALTGSGLISKKISMVLLCWLVAILGFNLLFYAGVPDIKNRYAFPYWPALLGLFGFFCARVVLSPKPSIFHAKRHSRLFFILPVFLMLAALMSRNILAGYRYTAATKRTDLAISEIISKSKSQSVDEVVVIMNGPYAEPAISVSRFLKYRHLEKPLFLSVEDVSQHKMEVEGGAGYLPAINRGNDPERCLEVVFYVTKPSVCSKQVLVSWEIMTFSDMMSAVLVQGGLVPLQNNINKKTK